MLPPAPTPKDAYSAAKRTTDTTPPPSQNDFIDSPSRKAFQRMMREDMVTRVEAILGRKVIAFFSDNSIDPDCAAEVFLPAPAATPSDDTNG
jgi:hypothetical protein